MDKKYNALFTPWRINSLTIKNRIVMTSMGGTSLFGWMEPIHFDKEAAKFILERAKNNVGLILPGIAPIKNPMMGGWIHHHKRMFNELKEFMDEVHATGAKLFIQLTAGFGRSMALNPLMEKCCTNKFFGALMKPIFNMNWINAAPSVTPNRWSDKVMTKAMSEKQIRKLINGFAKTAKLCQEAGVDGVEVHAVHEGYLLDQFTMPYSNKRDDQWGGSFENRYRFPVEIVKAIKATCGNDFPVSLRFSVISKTKGFNQGALPGEDYKEVGRDLEEAKRAAKYLQDAGYDMLNCDNGTYDAWYWPHPPAYMGRNCNLKDVSKIKPFVNIPIVCAGNMDADVASRAIADGEIDAMGVARQFLVDPEWINKLSDNRLEDIKPCIQCHNGCFNMSHFKGVPNAQSLNDALHMARCALNPLTMQSKRYFIKEAKIKKKVAVIGGGIGGMESALLLAKRGHEVTLFEKSGALGGVFIAASAPEFKESDRALIAWYQHAIKQQDNLTVKLLCEIKVDDPLLDEFDEIIVATGAREKRVRIPGQEKSITAIDYLLRKKKVGYKPLVIGGGLTGSEIAYELSLQGKQVMIVEMTDDLIKSPGVCLANSSYLRDYFKLHKVPVYYEHTVKEITDKGVIIIDKNKKETFVSCTNVITSIGYTPAPVLKLGPHIHYVGDCSHIGNLRTVIWQAWDVCIKI